MAGLGTLLSFPLLFINSKDKDTGVGCYFLLQGIFLTKGLNPGLLHYRQIFTILATREAQKKHHWTQINLLSPKESSIRSIISQQIALHTVLNKEHPWSLTYMFWIKETVSQPWWELFSSPFFLFFLLFWGFVVVLNAFLKDSRKGSPLENISWFEGGLNKQMITTPISPLCLQPAESICLLAAELPTSKGKLIRHRQTLRQSHLVNVSVFLSFGKSLSCLWAWDNKSPANKFPALPLVRPNGSQWLEVKGGSLVR